MIQKKRVFITGLSALTACGLSLEDTWSSVMNGEDGIDKVQNWDLSQWPTPLAGELKNFKPAKMLPDKKLIKVISRQDVMGINAACQAVEHSQIIQHRESMTDDTVFNDKTGVYVGSPGNKYYQQYDFMSLVAKSEGNMKSFAEDLFSEVHPMWLLRILPNNVLAYTGITYGFKGANHNITNHATSGMQAIIEAFHAIQAGQIERAVVVGYDVAPEPQAQFYYDKLGVLSHKALKPFDISHDGTVLAEGAAALVIESEQSANSRQATCYSEIISGSSKSEASGMFSVDEDGHHLHMQLSEMLTDNHVSPNDIGMIVAHGNGNAKSDSTEAMAFQRLFNQEAPCLTAFKWATGHTIAASGILDTVLAAKSMEQKTIPGIFNFEQPATGAEQLNISNKHRPFSENKPYAVIVNRGFASMNTGLVIKRCE